MHTITDQEILEIIKDFNLLNPNNENNIKEVCEELKDSANFFFNLHVKNHEVVIDFIKESGARDKIPQERIIKLILEFNEEFISQILSHLSFYEALGSFIKIQHELKK